MTKEHFELSDAVSKEINHWLTKFPADQKQSAILPALTALQNEQGYLSEAAMNAVAEFLDVPYISVYEVATFYSMYDLHPIGKHKISVCTNISCMLNGCDKIVDHLKHKLSIDFGESTADGKFYLEEVECLAACTNAPMMIIGNEYHENLTPEKVDDILEKLS